MYFWAVLLSFGAVGLSITGGTAELVLAIGLALVVGVVVVLSPRARRAAREARAAELAAQRRRSRAAHPTARALRPADEPAVVTPAPADTDVPASAPPQVAR
jgi:UDP-GlcNAc:undecaprenyl-phosphate GlcNAc-1-phosphate transferase